MSYNDFSRSDIPRRRLAYLTPSTATSRLYQCPAGKAARIDSVHVVNIHSGSADFTVHHLAPGETASTGNAIYYQVSISKNVVITDDVVKYLVSGDQLVASCSSGAHVTITVYGEEA